MYKKELTRGGGEVELHCIVARTVYTTRRSPPMKKVLKSLAFLAAATLAGSAFADAQWLGNSYIHANGTWYQAHGTENWASGGAFDGRDLGTVTSIELGGQLQIGDNGNNWGSGAGDWMHYSIDGGEAQHINLAYESYGYGEYYNNMRFQSGGGSFVTTSVDVSGLSAGRHTIAVSFGPVDGVYENGQTSETLYTAGFMVAAGGGGGTVVTTNTVTYTPDSKTSVTVSGTAPEGSSAAYAQSYNTVGQATSNNYLRLTLSGYAGKTITGLTLSMKSNAKTGRGSLDVTCGGATIAAIANSTFSNGWYATYSSSYVDIKPTVTPTVIDNNDVVIEINCTWNSLYCQSYAVTYTEETTAPTAFTVSLTPATDFEVEKETTASVAATPQNPPAGAVSYEWTIDGNPAGGSGYVLSLPTTVEGDHTVTCTAIGSDSSRTSPASVTYTVYAMYDVTVDPNIQHGTVTVDPARARAGESVTVTASGVGYEVETLTYSYNGGEPIDIVNGSFTMPAADVTVTATFVEVIDYTHLPFEHNTTWKNANVTGLTVSGCGTDYNSGDGAKLDAAGAYVQVKFDEVPSQLIYTIKANGSTTAAFDFEVQESDTGASWTPLASFTDDGTAIPSSETTYTNDLKATTRVVRFIHVTKGTGQNVGLYYVKIEAEVPATQYSVTVDENIQNGTVTVDKAEAAEGATVNVTASPDRGYALATLQYNGTDIVNGSFTMPAADVEVTATFTAVPVYKRVESADDFVTGAKYLVVAYKDGNNGYTSALKNVATDNGQISVDETISIEFADDGKFISVDDASIVWKVLVGNEAGVDYVLYNEGEQVYAAALRDANNAQLLADGVDALAQWSLDFTDVPEVKFYSRSYSTRWLQRNGTLNNKFFATYNTTGTAPWLFIDNTVESQRVTFDLNDGSGTVTTMRYVKGEQYPWFEKPASAGRVFLGWFDQAEGGNRLAAGYVTPVTAADERTLYAHWATQQTVKFFANGGSCSPASLVCNIGGTYPELPTPVLAGHQFLGWYTIDGDQTVATGDDVTCETSRTLYAHWAGQDIQTVSCNPNGGIWSGGSRAPLAVACGIGATYPAFPTPLWTGHVFTGWYTEANGGTRVTSGSEVSDAAARTVYAHWTTTQTLKFDPNGGTCATASIPCEMGGVYPELPVPTWSGHTFSGWFTEAGVRVVEGDFVTIEKSRVLYAQWEGQSTQVVTFNPNGGTCSKTSMTVTIGSTYPTFPTPTCPGYVFTGWYTAAQDGTRVYSGASGSVVTEDATRTLYAQWSSTQTVKFDPNGGTCGTATIPCAMGGVYPALPVPTWDDDHTFIGWFTEAGGGISVTAGDTVTFESSRVLYAHWEGQSTQVVTFNANGGTCAKTSMTASIGAKYPIFPTPKRTGYKFKGWFTEAEAGTRVYSGSSGTTVTEDATRTLYAHWQEGSVAISGISMTFRAASAGRRALTVATECTLCFESVADVLYEIQWTPSLGGEWTVLKRWIADEDGDSAVTVVVPSDSSTGFFRLVLPDVE